MAKGKNSGAKKAAKIIKAGRNAVKNRKVWRRVKFSHPKPLALKRNPLILKKAHQKLSLKDKYSVIQYPLNSETAMRCIEDQNTLVFIVNVQSSKTTIKRAFKDLYGKKPVKINTLIRPDGLKKAFIKLPPEEEAADIASKIGIM